jgi:hypothetical protein
MARSTTFQAKNVSGSTISAGKVVYISGFDEDSSTIDLASNNNENTMPAIGITQENILDDTTGIIRTIGLLGGFDTSLYDENTEVYVGVNGDVVYSDPAGSGIISQQVGLVAYSNADGMIMVFPLGRGEHGSLAGLDDDDHSIYSLVNGTRTFTGAVSGVTPTQDSHLTTKEYIDGRLYSASNGNVAFYTNAGESVTGNDDLYWDSTNSRLGIRTTTPEMALDVVGGMQSVATQYGAALSTFNYADAAAEHTNGTGSYDHTGNALGEKIFTATAGDAFTQADEDDSNWVVFTGTNSGAMAEIKRFIDGTHVEVDGLGWTGDFVSQTFSVYNHPSFVIGDTNKTEYSVGSLGEFEIFSYDFTNSCMTQIKLDSATDDTQALCVEANANGYNHNDAMHIRYDTGALQNGDSAHVFHINVDETSAAGNSTTHAHILHMETTDVSSIEKEGIHIGPGFDTALHVTGTAADDPDYGYEVTSGTVVDRVNSGGAGDNAFINAAVDQQIFDNNNDYILIGNDDTFEIIRVNLATNGNQDSNLEFYFSIAGVGVSGWTQFYPQDGTNGFRQSGSIVFNAPATWAKNDEAEANGDITNAYYIAIKRTRIGAYTYPVEDFFKIFLNQAGGMEVRGDGVVILPYLGGAPTNPVPTNGCIWMEADGLHIYYNDAEKTVAGI